MVHILNTVLKKVHEALRPNGHLLIIQPARRNAIIRLVVKGRERLCEEFDEPNFLDYLRATEHAICLSAEKKLFVTLDEANYPEGDHWLVHVYDSLDEYDEDHRSSCEDIMAFDTLVKRIKKKAGSKAHKVEEYIKEYRILLQKHCKVVPDVAEAAIR